MPTISQSIHGGEYWITRPVAFVCDWPRGKDGKRLVSREEAEARAKASTEAGRPQIAVAARSGGYRVKDVPLSSPMRPRYAKTNVKLSEVAVREVRADYKVGRYSMRDLARQRGVSYPALWQAIHGVTWADVS